MLGVCLCHHEERSDVVVSWEWNGGVSFSETAIPPTNVGVGTPRSDSIVSRSDSKKSGHSLHRAFGRKVFLCRWGDVLCVAALWIGK